MRYLYEFIGTFFLVFTVGMTVLNPDAGLIAPFAIGSILAVMVYAGAHISGGHYNPAVSLAVYLRHKLTCRDLVAYWVLQLAAAVGAAYLTVWYQGMPDPRNAMILPIWQTLVFEFLFAFALCFVVLNVTTAMETIGNSFYGFAVGFLVLAGTYAFGAVSSASFNPAVALGESILNLLAWRNIWIFFVANFLGGALAALIFNLTRPVNGECCSTEDVACCNHFNHKKDVI